MIATVSDFTLNLSQIISIELKTTCYDDEMDKVIFSVRLCHNMYIIPKRAYIH